MCDRDAFSDNLDAKPHGRLDVLMAVLRSVLVLVFKLDYALQATVLVMFAWVTGVVAAYSYLKYQPFYSAVINRSVTAAAFVYCWACVCLSMLQARKLPEVPPCA
jgi:hypothetical protein